MKLVKGLQKWIDGYQEVKTLSDELELSFDFYKDELVTEEEVDQAYANALTAIVTGKQMLFPSHDIPPNVQTNVPIATTVIKYPHTFLILSKSDFIGFKNPGDDVGVIFFFVAIILN